MTNGALEEVARMLRNARTLIDGRYQIQAHQMTQSLAEIFSCYDFFPLSTTQAVFISILNMHLLLMELYGGGGGALRAEKL